MGTIETPARRVVCTIHLRTVQDEKRDDALVARLSDPFFRVGRTEGNVDWVVVNHTATAREVRLRGFRNLEPFAPNQDPFADVTLRRKVNAPANASGTITVNTTGQGVFQDQYKYNVVVDGVLALDPELELM